MRVDFHKLRGVLRSSSRKTTTANQSVDCLSEFTASLTNYIEHNHSLTEEQSAMFIMSIENWMNRGKFTRFVDADGCSEVKLGEIFYSELGINFKPEVGHPHPVVILEEVGNLVLVVPVTTSSSLVNQAFHPLDHPTGNALMRKVLRSDGFEKDSAIILSNMRVISKGRLISRKGRLTNINDSSSLFAEIKGKCFQFAFPKQFIELRKKIHEVETLKEKIVQLEAKIQDMETNK